MRPHLTHAFTASSKRTPFSHRDDVSISGPSTMRSSIPSVLHVGRQLATVGCELSHHLLVKPDIHRGGMVETPNILGPSPIPCEHSGWSRHRAPSQINDPGPPCQLFLLATALSRMAAMSSRRPSAEPSDEGAARCLLQVPLSCCRFAWVPKTALTIFPNMLIVPLPIASSL